MKSSLDKIRDILHLYLGCEAEVNVTYRYPKKTHRLLKAVFLGINRLSVDTSYTARPFDVYGKPWDEFYETKEAPKPILRQLSSMTEEEARVITGYTAFENIREVTKFWKDDKCACVEYRWKHDGMVDGWAYSASAVYFTKDEWTPELFQYLLSKHFDLFNLIPEGLAIDADTLKTTSNAPAPTRQS
jgi:hypothetical protein